MCVCVCGGGGGTGLGIYVCVCVCVCTLGQRGALNKLIISFTAALLNTSLPLQLRFTVAGDCIEGKPCTALNSQKKQQQKTTATTVWQEHNKDSGRTLPQSTVLRARNCCRL